MFRYKGKINKRDVADVESTFKFEDRVSRSCPGWLWTCFSVGSLDHRLVPPGPADLRFLKNCL